MIGISRNPAGSRAICLTILILACALPPACATSPRPVSTAVELERTVLNLRAKNGGYVRRIEELENRVFVLEDQLDSRKLAAEQRAPATLPARGVGSDSSADPASPASPASAVVTGGGPGDDGSGTFETTIVAEHPVDYAGDAALPDAVAPSSSLESSAPRPMLRLKGKKPEPISPEPISPVPISPVPISPVPISPVSISPDRAVLHAPEPLPELRLAVSARPAPDALRGYRAALDTLKAGDPDAARVAFRAFLDGAPQHDYADNAQYWIGECYYTQQQYRAAERAFRKVVERYPRGNKVPDAMLKLGFTLQMLGDEAQARAVLESLTRAFPRHDASRLAVARLGRPRPAPARSAPGLVVPTLGTIVPVPSAAGLGLVAP